MTAAGAPTDPLEAGSTPEASASLEAGEVRRRASAGLVIVGTRSVAIMVLGLLSNVVLARLLTPRDFGIAAAGLTFISLVGLLSDGGLGGGLIRRPTPPDLLELRALLGLQLCVTIGMAAAIGGVALQFGQGGRVVALMVCAMPLVAFQFPGKIQLERALRYRPLAFVEVSQVLAYQVTAIALVAAGAGVWGLAIGWFARAIVGAVVTTAVSPIRVLRPSLSWGRIRSLLAFGTRLQLVSGTVIARDQGLNAVIGGISGIATLGMYTLAKRLLEVPYLVLNTLWRISMPAMSQLLAAKQAPGPLIQRALSVASVGTGIVLVMLGGSGPGLVPGVFGEHWRAAAHVLPGACLGMFISGSISVATQGFLYAVGDAAAVLRAAAVSAVTVLGVTLALLPSLGVWAAGVGLFVASLFESAALLSSTRRHAEVEVGRIVAIPAVLVACAIAAGWQVANTTGQNLASGFAGAAVALSCFLAGMGVLRRAQLSDFLRVARRAIANSRMHERDLIVERAAEAGTAT
jgi:O-antigen/teichoic acid export membrane protein